MTYGDRCHLCLTAVGEALKQGVGRAVIVSNGATANSLDELKAFARQQDSVDLIQLPRNIGSAGGFSTGLRHMAEQTKFPYVGLLDDDNVALENALTDLLSWRESCWQILARVRRHRSVRGPSGYPIHGSFVTRCVRRSRLSVSRRIRLLNVIEIPRKLVRKISARFRTRPRVTIPVEIPDGRYGGMLLPRSLISLVGYPDERLVLYEDDADYTRRLHEAGAELFVVPTALIKDIDGILGTRPRTAARNSDVSCQRRRKLASISAIGTAFTSRHLGGADPRHTYQTSSAQHRNSLDTGRLPPQHVRSLMLLRALQLQGRKRLRFMRFAVRLTDNKSRDDMSAVHKLALPAFAADHAIVDENVGGLWQTCRRLRASHPELGPFALPAL